MIYLIYCNNFYKCHNVYPPSTTVKKKKENNVHVFESVRILAIRENSINGAFRKETEILMIAYMHRSAKVHIYMYWDVVQELGCLSGKCLD
jgi:hypothetical protein